MRATEPALKDLQVASDGWKEVRQIATKRRLSADDYDEMNRIVGGSIVQVQAHAIRTVEAFEPDTPEIVVLRDKYAAALRRTQEGANSARTALGRLSRGGGKDARRQLQQSQQYMVEGKTMLKEVGKTLTKLSRRYGSLQRDGKYHHALHKRQD